MLKDQQMKKFLELLKDQHDWPTDYLFKFIVPYDKVEEVEKLFPDHDMEKKGSKLGNYVSLTISIQMDSADVVIAVYQQASRIKGLIAL